MPLHIIGLGLGDDQDITLKGIEAIKRCQRVFLEAYTSILGVSTERLEQTYGKKVELAHRETVESESDTILEPAKSGDVAFLVVGDAFGATTHTDLFLRAAEAGIKVNVIHNASIMNAAGACGLQLYNFGQTVSIPFWRTDALRHAGLGTGGLGAGPGGDELGEWTPDSFYDKIAYNAGGGMHTLCLLDIKVREPDFAALVRTGRRTWLPPRYMTVNQACLQLIACEERHRKGVCGPQARAIGLARVGHADQRIVSGSLEQLATVEFGEPLHSLVLVAPSGHTHEVEEAMVRLYQYKEGQYPVWKAPVEEEEHSDSGSDDE